MSSVVTKLNPEACLRVYWEAKSLTGEVGNAEIREMFGGTIGSTKLQRIKKSAQKEMAEKGIMRVSSYGVNIDILFNQLGLDIDRMEKYNRKLEKMRAAKQ